MKVRFQIVDSILDEVESIQRRIAERAEKVFHERGGTLGHALEDWVKAERQTIWRPALEVVRTKDGFVVEAAVAGIDPKQLDVRVTPTQLLLRAELQQSDSEQEGEVLLCEFVKGPLFRSYTFPELVDPGRVSADCRNGLLRVIVPRAQPSTKVDVVAA